MTDHQSAPTTSAFASNSYADSYQPPTASDDLLGAPPVVMSSPPATSDISTTGLDISQASAADPSAAASQKLEDQNIFYLLGVQGSDDEKEAFLDELQQVIWEDFLDRDVELLITSSEQTQLQEILAKKELTSEQQQEEVLVFLDKLIPDLEAIMLEKALELKEDMVRERVAGMREFYAEQTEKLATLSQAEQLMNEAQWRAAADLLNTLS
jgi:hypothetical protein